MCRPAHVRGLPGQCLEMMWCVVRQFNIISVVHKEEFSLMRASFYFTHRIDSGAAPAASFSTHKCRDWSNACRGLDLAHQEQRRQPASVVLQSLSPAERLTLGLICCCCRKGGLSCCLPKRRMLMSEEGGVIAVPLRLMRGSICRLDGSCGRYVVVYSACAGAKFDFISYMRDSMEDDYGRLVGLGLPMWLFLIFFVLLSSVWGAFFQKH